MNESASDATIPRLVRRNAAQSPDGIAIIDGERILSFAEFDQAMSDAVRALIAFGVAPGDRIGIWAPNSADWLVAAMGVLGAGAILLPINSRLRGAEAAEILRRASAKAVFTVGSFLGMDYPSMLREAAPGLPVAIIDLSGEAAGSQGVVAWRDLIDRGVAAVSMEQANALIEGIPDHAICDILFTSGTTGLPKGVVTTRASTIGSYRQYARTLGIRRGDRLLLSPPLGLVYGFKGIFLVATLMQAAVVLQSVFDAVATMELIETHGVTYFTGPPTMIQDVLDSPDRARFDLSSLRIVLLGGSDIQAALIDRIRHERLARHVYSCFGMSEIGAAAMTCRDDPGDTIATTVGKALPGTAIAIRDDDGISLPPGTVGEICIRSATMFDCYLDDPAQTAAAFTVDGWYRSGDMGMLDDHGYLTVAGRKKDMLITGGFNVYPAEVERVLGEHDAIDQIAVVAMPDARLREVGAAFVVARPGQLVAAEDLIAWAKVRLASFKVPRRVIVVDALPVSIAGKVMRDRLRAEAARLAAATENCIEDDQ